MARIGVVALLVVLLCGLARGQDPGIPDTVYFMGVENYVYGPPFEGNIKIDVFFYNDENLTGIEVPLVWSGPVVFDSGTFDDARTESLSAQTLVLDSTNNTILIQAGAIPPGPQQIPPGTGKLVTIMGTVYDTGSVVLDSTRFDIFSLRFVLEQPMDIIPVFKKLQFAIEPSSIEPGGCRYEWDSESGRCHCPGKSHFSWFTT